MAVIDLSVMPEGATYEDRYSGYLDVFRACATNNDVDVIVKRPPASWVPLLKHLRCQPQDPQIFFEHDIMMLKLINCNFDRTAVEVLCGFRPETTDALWKVDMQWEVAPNRKIHPENKSNFIVTTNGSFHRPEVMHYIRHVLPTYTPQKKKVVLVPCAADKPYPSKLHKAVLEMMPDDFYLANVTGVLGIVPQDLWPEMPYYDSGVPYEWRLRNILAGYLTKRRHERIVVYADFYNLAIDEAVWSANHGPRTWFVNPVIFYQDYLDLLQPKLLKQLEEVFKGEWVNQHG